MLTEDKTATTGNSDGKARFSKICNAAHEVMDTFFADQDYDTTQAKLQLMDDIVFFLKEKYGISRLESCNEKLPMQDFHEIVIVAMQYAVHEKSVANNVPWPFSE